MVQAKKKNVVETLARKKDETASIPPLQIALDLVDLPRAIQIAAEAVKGIISETQDISKASVEAGTPLIKAFGLCGAHIVG